MSLVSLGASPPPSFEDPIGMLLHCHRRMEEQLAALDRAAAALGVSPDDALTAVEAALKWLETAGTRHTEDEEASFFPRLYGVADLLAELSAEHRTTEAIFLALRTVVRRVREDPSLLSTVAEDLRAHATALAAAYRDHISAEETRFIPLARDLDPAELRAIGIEMSLRRGGKKG